MYKTCRTNPQSQTYNFKSSNPNLKSSNLNLKVSTLHLVKTDKAVIFYVPIPPPERNP